VATKIGKGSRAKKPQGHSAQTDGKFKRPEGNHGAISDDLTTIEHCYRGFLRFEITRGGHFCEGAKKDPWPEGRLRKTEQKCGERF